MYIFLVIEKKTSKTIYTFFTGFEKKVQKIQEGWKCQITYNAKLLVLRKLGHEKVLEEELVANNGSDNLRSPNSKSAPYSSIVD